MNQKRIFFILLILALPFFLTGQSLEQSFCLQSSRITQTGMIVLGAWSLGNISAGAIGWSQTSGQQKYFHQMNLFWNTVNLAIAGYGYYTNSLTDCSTMAFSEVFAKHQQTEKILLINSLLDVGYIGAGFGMRYFSSKFPNRTEMLKGYGNSLILQGGFLLVFDGILYAIMKNTSASLPQNLQLSLTGEFPGIQFVMTL
jgi:hypothetical protein